jgi:hypothetical protein
MVESSRQSKRQNVHAASATASQV